MLKFRLLVFAWFVGAGLLFIGQTGLHHDASYELGAFYPCCQPAYRIEVSGASIPLMILPYLGALKTWLYWPILHYLEVTPFILRLPLVLIAGASVCLFGAILYRVSGRRAAIIGSLLLATDGTFLIASAYDFGPIVLLHLFLLAGVLLLLRFNESQKLRYLALAFFLFGLAFWHKALFGWMFGGLAVAAVVVFQARIRALFSWRRAMAAALSLAAGALPLLYYNAATSGATLRIGEVMSGAAPFGQKLLVLRKTLDGSILFGWLSDEASAESVRQASGPAGRASAFVAASSGGVRSNLFLYGFLASLLLLPWLRQAAARKAALFALLYLAVAWGMMALTPNAGAALHHAILLWPFPHFLVAVTAAELMSRRNIVLRRVVTSCIVLILVVGVLQVNRYYHSLTTRGTTTIWTDALDPLHQYLDSLSDRRIVALDWGYSTSLCLLSDGRMPMIDLSYALLDPEAAKAGLLDSFVTDGRTYFVLHAEGAEIFPDVRRRLNEAAARLGYSGRVVHSIKDRNGRPKFDVLAFIPQPPS